MENSLGYGAEEAYADNGPRFQPQEEYMLAKRRSSQEFLQYRSYHLHLKRKREGTPQFTNIPTSYWERLSYYRTYTNSINKIQILTFNSSDFNRRFWTMLLGAIFATFPYTYVHVFLATYVPETPLYLEKMVPFMEVNTMEVSNKIISANELRGLTGISISIIIAAVFELFTYVENGVYILDFLFNAIFSKNPWNECPEEGYFKLQNEDVYCYHLYNIAERIKNKTVIFDKMYYTIVEDNIKFQFGQIQYYSTRKQIISNWLVLLYGIIIWAIVVICYEKIYSRGIWKVLHVAHSLIVVNFVVSYTYHLMNNVGDEIPDIDCIHDPVTKYFPKLNFNLFSISLFAPPVVHILNSRSSDEIHPNQDTAAIVISNMLFSLLRILTTAKTKHYMETFSQLPIHMPARTNLGTWFIYFPLYFSLFYFGDVFSMLFFLQLFITETTSCIIQLELTLDIIMNKWEELPRRIMGVVLITVAIMVNTIQRYLTWSSMLVMFFNKLTVILLEVIIIFWMYPVFRLADDMAFHHGYPMSTIRLFGLITTPFVILYVSYKTLHTCFVHMLPSNWGQHIFVAILVAIPSAGVPVVAGMCYAYYEYVLKARRSWKRMFAPAEDWGPTNYVERQLRKDYDSRTYTNSEVSRSLSRHIFAKTEKKAYELDISYDPNRRSTQIGHELGSEIKKK